jgi:hypothetical protein
VKSHQFIRVILAGLAVLVAVLTVGIYWVNQSRQGELQRVHLYSLFIKVQRRNEKALLVPNNKPRFGRLYRQDGSYFNGPTFVSVGTRFNDSDRHYGIVYAIQEIGSDGVTIYYKADGGPPSGVRSSSGTIILPWK